MRKLIKVTKKHINNGEMGSPWLCPIADALMETIQSNNVCVASRITIDNNDYKLPRSAERFIRRFDEGKPVKPFNFFLVESE